MAPSTTIPPLAPQTTPAISIPSISITSDLSSDVSSPANNSARLVRNEAKSRKKKLNFSCSQELVTLLVGKEENAIKFVIHKEFACHYSPIFETAFNSPFIEGQTQEYRLEDASEGAAQFLIQWIYHQELEITQLEEGNAQDDTQETQELIYLWVLADKLIMPKLQNQAIRILDQIIRKRLSLSLSHLSYVYENTPPGSPLRQYFVRACACYLKTGFPESSLEKLPKEFLMELVSILKLEQTFESRRKIAPHRNLTEFDVVE